MKVARKVFGSYSRFSFFRTLKVEVACANGSKSTKVLEMPSKCLLALNKCAVVRPVLPGISDCIFASMKIAL